MSISVMPVPNQPPKAIAGDDLNVKVGQPIQFDGTASRDPDGNIVAYHWDFGNGETSTTARPIYVYHDPGKYQVRLEVKDDHLTKATRSSDMLSVIVKQVSKGESQ
jgi:PKD repeat protein